MDHEKSKLIFENWNLFLEEIEKIDEAPPKRRVKPPRRSGTASRPPSKKPKDPPPKTPAGVGKPGTLKPNVAYRLKDGKLMPSTDFIDGHVLAQRKAKKKLEKLAVKNDATLRLYDRGLKELKTFIVKNAAALGAALTISREVQKRRIALARLRVQQKKLEKSILLYTRMTKGAPTYPIDTILQSVGLITTINLSYLSYDLKRELNKIILTQQKLDKVNKNLITKFDKDFEDLKELSNRYEIALKNDDEKLLKELTPRLEEQYDLIIDHIDEMQTLEEFKQDIVARVNDLLDQYRATEKEIKNQIRKDQPAKVEPRGAEEPTRAGEGSLAYDEDEFPAGFPDEFGRRPPVDPEELELVDDGTSADNFEQGLEDAAEEPGGRPVPKPPRRPKAPKPTKTRPPRKRRRERRRPGTTADDLGINLDE